MTKTACVALVAALIVPGAAYAQRLGVGGAPGLPPPAPGEWHATVGVESDDKGHQGLAFLPSEMWIHSGDSITWHFNTDEIHTVSFLKSGQIRYPFFIGCPGFTPDPGTFDNTTCVTTPPQVTGDTYTVFFPSTGNFKLVCLVHENMTAVVHVLALGEPLPHDQTFYDREAGEHAKELLADKKLPKHTDAQAGAPAQGNVANHDHHANTVVAGIGEVSATAGGSDTLSILRFLHDDIVIHAGETVEFDNLDPVTPHTITFGDEPPGDPAPPSPDVTVDSDGARHAVIDSTSDSTHSGFIVASPQDHVMEPQTPLGVTRFRVTFPNPGTFPYICALHDDLGMVGKVIVVP